MQSGRERLRAWIDRSKFNQRQAAELLQFTEVFLSQILNGTRRPGLENAIHIEDVTGISVESWLRSDISETDDAEPVTVNRGRKTKR